MEKELTGKLQEIIHKCQAWVDDEKYIPKKFRTQSESEKFAEKIRVELEAEMIRQKFSFDHNKIYLPTNYTVLISEPDNQEFRGIKREVLIGELNRFVERFFIVLSMNYHGHHFVELKTSPDLQIGEVKVLHHWEDSYSPNILINQTTEITEPCKSSEIPEETILFSSIWEKTNNGSENESETIVRKKNQKYYGLEIWREGNKQGSLPIFQPEIIIGRGAPSIYVDIPLVGVFTHQPPPRCHYLSFNSPI